MAETTGKRFYISEKSVKNEIYSCPPLETLPNKNTPVDCFCERRRYNDQNEESKT